MANWQADFMYLSYLSQVFNVFRTILTDFMWKTAIMDYVKKWWLELCFIYVPTVTPLEVALFFDELTQNIPNKIPKQELHNEWII